jgi:glutathione S-transferase
VTHTGSFHRLRANIALRHVAGNIALRHSAGMMDDVRMILIGQFDSPFVRRVGIALHLYGLRHEHRPWSVWADADAIAAFNPLRRVPVLLLDDGEALIESGAILDALDDLVGPTRALTPQSADARRSARQVAALATGMGDKAVVLLYEHVLRAEANRSPAWVARCQSQIVATLATLERAYLGRPAGPYWAGEAVGHADIAVACAVGFLREAHPELTATLAGATPLIDRLCATCEALPSFQAVRQPLKVAV